MSGGRRFALYGLLLLSGSAGLGYQTLWTKTLTVALGHEMPSLIAVVAAFFAGLSLGAWTLGRRIGQSAHPQRWYAGFELVIAGWALASLVLLPWLASAAATALGVQPHPAVQWLMAFALPFAGLLPATFAMGATLPAMEQVLARASARGEVVGGAYAANTAGALFGVLGSVFWLLPTYGQQTTLLLFAATNVVCAVGALLLVRGASTPLATAPAGGPTAAGATHLSLLLFGTGLLGIGYEVLAVRVMSQVFEGTLYSFATALAVYLAASSAGAAAFQRYADRLAPERWLTGLLAALGWSCLLGLIVLYQAQPLYRALRLATGDTVLDVLLSEMLLALSVYLLPSLLMGATFTLLAQSARNQAGDIGRALGLNTLGSAFAPAVFGVVLLPLAGAKWALGALVLGYLALLPPARAGRRRLQIALRFVPPVVLLLLPALQVVTLREGEEVLSYREGIMAATAVVERGNARNLRVNNRYQMGGTSAEALLFQRRQAHIPILLHPAPDKALFLGVASGATIGAAASHQNLELDAVELVPEVLGLLEYFSPHNDAPQDRANVKLYAADARRFVRVADKHYDVIVADLFHPARDGAGLLFTREHYQAIAGRLADDGVFCHWLPFHQLDMTMIRLITRTFQSVFPDAHLVLASDLLKYPALGLVTGFDGAQVSRGYLKQRVEDPALRQALQRVLLSNDLQLFATVLLDDEALAALAGPGPLNTDDLPLVSYRAPRFSYDRGSQPYGRLMDLLAAHNAHVPRTLAAATQTDPAFDTRLRRFVRARNIYLHALQAHIENGEDAALTLYLASARASSDYHTGFAQLFRVARTRAEQSPSSALAILEVLHELRPDLPAVEDLRRRLTAGAASGAGDGPAGRPQN
ncbi:MAG: fused MFS/spermidine synthase [Pseudomonadota bacterium]